MILGLIAAAALWLVVAYRIAVRDRHRRFARYIDARLQAEYLAAMCRAIVGVGECGTALRGIGVAAERASANIAALAEAWGRSVGDTQP